MDKRCIWFPVSSYLFPSNSDICDQVVDLTITNADPDGTNDPASWHIANCQSADQAHLMEMIKKYLSHNEKMAILKDEPKPPWGPPPDGWPQQ